MIYCFQQIKLNRRVTHIEYKRLEIERIDFDDLPNWMEDTNELPSLPPEWQELQEEMKDFQAARTARDVLRVRCSIKMKMWY